MIRSVNSRKATNPDVPLKQVKLSVDVLEQRLANIIIRKNKDSQNIKIQICTDIKQFLEDLHKPADVESFLEGFFQLAGKTGVFQKSGNLIFQKLDNRKLVLSTLITYLYFSIGLVTSYSSPNLKLVALSRITLLKPQASNLAISNP